MTRVKVQAFEDGAEVANNGDVFVRDKTHADGGTWQAPSGGGGGGSLNLSAGTTSNNLTNVVFSNSNNVSFGLNGSTVTAIVTVASTAGSVTVSAGTSTAALGSLVFSDQNGVYWGLNGSTITAYRPTDNVTISAGTQSWGNLAYTFANSNGVTFGMSNGQITASVNAGGGGSLNLSAGTTSNNLTNVVFSNSNGVTFGLNGSTVTASASQSNQAASASNGSFAFQTIAFSNANNVTFGTSAGSIITASVAAGGGGGGTISLWPPMPPGLASSSMYAGSTNSAAGPSYTTTWSIYVSPLPLPAALHGMHVEIIASFSSLSVASTGSATAAHAVGLYSMNAGQLTLHTSYQLGQLYQYNSSTNQTAILYEGATVTSNSTTAAGNISSLLTGYRLMNLGDNKTAYTLSAGQWYLAVAYTRRSSNIAIGLANTIMCVSASQTTAPGRLLLAGTTLPFGPIGGIYSTTQTATILNGIALMPSSLNTTRLTYTGGTSQHRWNHVVLHSRYA